MQGDPALNHIAVARIIKERGIKGEVKAFPLSEAAQSLPPLTEAYVVMPAGTVQKKTIHSIRTDREFLIISFHGISDRQEASRLRNAMIEVDASMLPGLAKNEYYYHQIIGLSVVTADGTMIGRVTGIMETPGNELYVVQGKDKEHLIPAVKQIVADIDLNTGTITITPIDGLLD
ncbi:MAG: 16S rRNA processing protein RimM [Nitrospirae bacterium]|nr:16S rRNA processing protein RimM [Nitrospirota bacterium]